MPDALLTAKEAAVVLNLSTNKVKRLIKAGELECYRIPTRGDIRVAQKHIDAFLARAER